MKDERLLQLGQKIRYERLKKGLSQEGLEENLWFQEELSVKLKEVMLILDIQIFYQIAEALNMSVSELLNFKL